MRVSGSVCGKLPCTRPSWLPNIEYHGILMPAAVNGLRAASSSPVTCGKPNRDL